MRTILAVAIVLIGACLLAYAGALHNPLLYDDEAYIKNNPNLEMSRIASLVKTDYYDFFPPPGVLSYRPTSTFLYIVNRSIWGERYGGWRLTYLLLHAMNGLLLFWILSRWKKSFLPAALTSLLFVLHPVHSEVINQISYDEDVVMTALLLAASCVYLNWRNSRRRSHMLLVAVLFFLALLTKETALFFLPVLIVHIAAARRPVNREERWTRGEYSLLVLTGLAAVLYLALRLGPMQSPVEGSSMGDFSLGFAEYLAEVCRLLWDFLVRFLWPLNLSAVYRFPPASWGSPSVLAGAGLLLALLGAVAAGVVRRKPLLAVPAAWYLAGLSTILYAVMTEDYTLAWDHYIYCASIGLLMYFFLGIRFLLESIPSGTRRHATGVGLAVAICALCLPVVWERNIVWSSNVNLWSDATRKAPLSQVAHYNLGYTHWEGGNFEEAVEEYLLTTELDPGYFMAQVNLGLLYKQEGKLDLAEERFRKALGIMPKNKRALLGLGYILLGKKRFVEAYDAFRKVIELNPRDLSALTGAAAVRMEQGRYGEAAALYRTALEVSPDSPVLKRYLAQALRLQGASISGESGRVK